MAGTPIAQMAGYLENVPDPQLQALMKNPNPQVPLYLVVSELSRRAATRSAAQSNPQGPAPQTTVMQDLMAQTDPMAAGIAGTPEMSMGADRPEPQGMQQGVASFASGGVVDYYDPVYEDEEEDKWYSFGPRSKLPGGPAGPDLWESADLSHLPGQAWEAIKSGANDVNNRLMDGVRAGTSLLTGQGLPAFTGKLPFVPNPAAAAKAPRMDEFSDDSQPNLLAPPSTPAAVPPPAQLMPGEQGGVPAAARRAPLPAPTGGIASVGSGLQRSDYYDPKEEAPPAPEPKAHEEFIALIDKYIGPDEVTPEMLKRLRKREEELDEARKAAGPAALIQTGLAIMMGRSDRALQNIAYGAMHGMNSYSKSVGDIDKQKREVDDDTFKVMQYGQKRKADMFGMADQMRTRDFSMANQAADDKYRRFRDEQMLGEQMYRTDQTDQRMRQQTAMQIADRQEARAERRALAAERKQGVDDNKLYNAAVRNYDATKKEFITRRMKTMEGKMLSAEQIPLLEAEADQYARQNLPKKYKDALGYEERAPQPVPQTGQPNSPGDTAVRHAEAQALIQRGVSKDKVNAQLKARGYPPLP